MKYVNYLIDFQYIYFMLKLSKVHFCCLWLKILMLAREKGKATGAPCHESKEGGEMP